jgi:Sulfatase
MIAARDILGTHDCVFMTLDALRYDAASAAMDRGLTPQFQRLLPGARWERRHSPATFTYAAHHAFFAGFLPTPARPGKHSRLFAARFAGSETTTDQTLVFDTPDIVSGFAAAGYHTACVGGVGFFNKQTPLGSVLPALFHENHWSPELGVTSRDSAAMQVALAEKILRDCRKRIFLFINISAIHQPNCIFTPAAIADTLETHINALAYVDSQLPPLIAALRDRGPALVICCSDHGTAYGEDGFHGHRLAHAVTYTVPYAEFILPGESR